MNDTVENMSIEEAFKALDDILAQLEGAGDNLEDSFGKYQQGLALVKHLNGKIDGIEKRIRILEAEGREGQA